MFLDFQGLVHSGAITNFIQYFNKVVDTFHTDDIIELGQGDKTFKLKEIEIHRQFAPNLKIETMIEALYKMAEKYPCSLPARMIVLKLNQAGHSDFWKQIVTNFIFYDETKKRNIPKTPNI